MQVLCPLYDKICEGEKGKRIHLLKAHPNLDFIDDHTSDDKTNTPSGIEEMYNILNKCEIKIVQILCKGINEEEPKIINLIEEIKSQLKTLEEENPKKYHFENLLSKISLLISHFLTTNVKLDKILLKKK